MAHWEWLWAGRDSILAIEERYAARSQFDPALLKRISSQGVALIHVNHAFNMGVAQKIAALARSAGFARPEIILETHDVQSHRYGRSRLANYFTKQADPPARILRDELRILGQADALIHISEDDVAHFRRALPDRRHFLLRPTTRNQPPSLPDKARSSIDFLFIGNAHHGNIASIQWFLTSVMPRVSGRGFRIRIVGGVAGWFRQHSPSVYAAHRDIWMDEQPQVAEIYESARFVIVPTMLGTGASIKLIEALAMAKHVVATPTAMAGIASVPGIEDAVRVAGNAEEFAAAMLDLAGLPEEPNLAGLDVYASHFSNACYQQALLAILREGIRAACLLTVLWNGAAAVVPLAG
ncbi:MAG: glycosyltransferase [Candidatus Kaistia colombiensis]|nr:MAG: glycosyltransferase [Kaistia sp.]